MIHSLSTPNDLSETQCLGLAFCLQGAVTSQWRAGSVGFTFSPVCRLFLICWSSRGNRVNLHNYLCPGHDPASNVTALKSLFWFLMQQLLLPGSPVGWQKPQQNQLEAVLGVCEQPACLNTCRDRSHLICSSLWPGGEFETAHHWKYENFVHKAREGNINNFHTLRTGRERESWRPNELKHEKPSKKY